MKFDNLLRKYSFWLKDKIKGGNIRAHYTDINSIITNYLKKKSAQKCSQYLEDILKHAITTTQYYNKIPNAVITDFPVVNKNIIRNNFNEFKSNDPKFKKSVSVVTSGSTGTPFSVDHDKRKRERNTADTIFFGELAGFTIGQRLYYFKIWNDINKKSRISAFAQNLVPYDVRDLSEEAISSVLVQLNNDHSEKTLLAYASVYDTICSYLLKFHSDPFNFNIKAIIAMSESFSSTSKGLIKKYFNVNAVSRYSNVENGIIAQQMPDGSDEFLVNDASYKIEILEMDSDKPVLPGYPGRIVITDLFNYCMPIIRYDTGDIGIMENKIMFGDLRLVFKLIEGRRMDMIYDTTDSLVSSFVITNNMWKYSEIRQYQFVQISGKDYLFKLNTDQPFLRSDELISEFKGYFGKDSKITIEYVHEIPLLESGKRKKVMNTYKK